MAGTWTADRFPQFEPAIRRLTEQHRELEDEPLHLALAYQPGPGRDQQDIYLFEVIGSRFGGDINPERELFETIFESAPGFPMDFGEKLHLILTNPEEVDLALRENWQSLREVLNAIRRGDCKELYADASGTELIERLRVASGSPQE